MIANDPNAEMRSAVRFPLQLPIAIKSIGHEMAAVTNNISAGGMLFYLGADEIVGSTIEFEISMPAAVLGASSDVLVAGAGRVIRCSAEGDRQAVAAVIDEYHFERR